MNSRRAFKSYQYFLGLKSNFKACFQDTFYLCGIIPEDLRLGYVVISANAVLVFKDIKISLGRSITVRKVHALFRENHCLEMSTTANNQIRGSAVETKVPSKS